MAYGDIEASEKLFRGTILKSGSATQSTPIPHPDFAFWQRIYDQIVNATGYLDLLMNNSIQANPWKLQ